MARVPVTGQRQLTNLRSYAPEQPTGAQSAFNDLQNTATEWMNDSAKALGAQEGREAVAAGDYNYDPDSFESNFTYRGAAKMGIQRPALIASKSDEMDAALLDLQQKYGRDPQRLREEMTKYKMNFYKDVPADVIPKLDEIYNHASRVANQKAFEVEDARKETVYQNQILTRYRNLNQKLVNAIGSGDDEGAALASAEIDALTEAGMLGSSEHDAFFTPLQKDAFAQAKRKTIIDAKKQAAYNAAKGMDAKKALGDSVTSGGFDFGTIKDPVTNKPMELTYEEKQDVVSWINTQVRQDQALYNTGMAEVLKKGKPFLDAMEKGHTTEGQAEWEAEANKYPELQDEIARAKLAGNGMNDFSSRSPENQQAIINHMEEQRAQGKLGPEQSKNLDKFIAIAEKNKTEWQNDPTATASKLSPANRINPIYWNDPKSLEERRFTVNFYNQFFKTTDENGNLVDNNLPLLTKDEQKQFKTEFESGDTESQLALLKNLRNLAGSDDEFQRTITGIVPKDSWAGFAAEWIDTDESIARQAFEGDKLLKNRSADGGITLSSGDDGDKTKINEAIRNLFPNDDGVNTENNIALSGLVQRLYAYKKSVNADATIDSVMTDLFGEAVNWGDNQSSWSDGTPIIMPHKDMNPTVVKASFDNMTESQFVAGLDGGTMPTDAIGNPISYKDFIANGKFVSHDGKGNYVPMMKNKTTGEWQAMKDKDNNVILWNYDNGMIGQGTAGRGQTLGQLLDSGILTGERSSDYNRGGASRDIIGDYMGSNSNVVPTEEIKNIINDAANLVGVDSSYMLDAARRESAFKPNAKAKTSSASGLFQFIDSTWESMVNKYGREFGIGYDDVFNPKANAIMGALFTRDNADYLKSRGIEPGKTELYLAHFFGAGGAANILTAGGKEIAADLNPKAARANQSLFYKKGRAVTVDEFIESVRKSMA